MKTINNPLKVGTVKFVTHTRLLSQIAGVRIPDDVTNLLAITQYLATAFSSKYGVIILTGGKKNLMVVTSKDVPQEVRTFAESLLSLENVENVITMLKFGKD